MKIKRPNDRFYPHVFHDGHSWVCRHPRIRPGCFGLRYYAVRGVSQRAAYDEWKYLHWGKI